MKEPEKGTVAGATVSSTVSFAPVVKFGENQVQYSKLVDRESQHGLAVEKT